MNSRERISRILDNKSADRVGFWIGHPADDTKLIYAKKLGLIGQDDDTTLELNHNGLLATDIDAMDIKLTAALESDVLWCSPELVSGTWKHPEGKPMFDYTGGVEKKALNQAGVFSEFTSVKEVEDFDWPDPKYLDFEPSRKLMESAAEKDLFIFGGMWLSFFHVLCDFFGMENYFMKMYTHPDVVEAATDKLLDFYLEANERCLDELSGHIDAVFFGNDLGSQFDLLISPDAFKKFILPGYKRIVSQARDYGYKVMLHSCGAVTKIIPDLIDIGVDALHPLQAKAAGMDAENLSKQFGNKITFVGGVDTQHLLPFGTPQQVRDEVRRLKDLLGPRFIVSPSHEALLSNVPIENVLAMKDESLKIDSGSQGRKGISSYKEIRLNSKSHSPVDVNQTDLTP